MNKIYLIRHGKTAGNEQKRYIGRTDEPLCASGRESLALCVAPQADIVAVSPLLRCRESAQILYPGREQFVVRDFRECDFGDFENKNYIELSSNPDYQAWVDSGGEMAFPHGESPKEFRARCAAAFARFCSSLKEGESAALIVHGGTIMSVLEAYAAQKRSFYDWHTENGQGYSAVWENECLQVEGKIWR